MLQHKGVLVVLVVLCARCKMDREVLLPSHMSAWLLSTVFTFIHCMQPIKVDAPGVIEDIFLRLLCTML